MAKTSVVDASGVNVDHLQDDFREFLRDRYGDDVERQLKLSVDVLDHRGYEVPDPVPMSPPVGFYNEESSLARFVRELVLSERLKQEADAANMETFEEADDFDLGDPDDHYSPYEETFEPPLPDGPLTEDEAIRARAMGISEDRINELRGGGGALPPSGEPKALAKPKAKPAKPRPAATPAEDEVDE